MIKIPRSVLIALAATALLAAGCGSNNTASNHDLDPTVTYAPPTTLVKTWAWTWCTEIHVADTRDHLAEALGNPTSTFNDQDQWEAYGYNLTANYDENQTVTSLQWDDANLSPNQKANFTCDQYRDDSI